MLQQQKDIVKATVPVLQQYGEAITTEFYKTLFAENPVLMNIFNPANQRSGGQARSLAASILAYAANIDQLDRLGGMVNRIAHKHASLEVQPEHYPIVGDHLLRAIRTVLGEAATPEILAAWGAAYQQLATVMVGAEQKLYHDGSSQPGGWAGFRPLTIVRKVEESQTITSFYLAASNGEPLPPFSPGQFLAVKVHVPDAPFQQIRQYSLSRTSDLSTYRISVKRELAPSHIAIANDGLISNHLHDSLREGDSILVHVPQGDFILQQSDRPVVLLSGGVGITPAICMLHHLAAHSPNRPVLFVHATLHGSHHAFREEIRQLISANSHLRSLTFYEKPSASDKLGIDYHHSGRISAETLTPHLPQQAEYYYCGPVGFMTAVDTLLDSLNIPSECRYSEAFAPDPDFSATIARA
jgi:nitric oxide dioxygenase